jgi:hypothetical protein
MFPFLRVLDNPTRGREESSRDVAEGVVNGPDDVYAWSEGRIARGG